jgi:hypothetical protein
VHLVAVFVLLFPLRVSSGVIYSYYDEVLAHLASPLTSLPEIPSSNVAHDTDCTEMLLVVYFSPAGKLRHNACRFLPHP